MAIQRIHSFLVHPSKNVAEPPEISGTEVPTGDGKLARMLRTLFERARDECDIDIVFRPDDDGRRLNPCHSLFVTYVAQATLPRGREIAHRLQSMTTNRSGLGLLFIIKGRVGTEQQLVVSRFPADQGVVAHERARELSVEFLERVFMKNAKAYKAAVFRSDAPDRGFWEGAAVDKQISDPRELSDYWIRDFLAAELRTTGAAGTRRLATALVSAVNSAPNLALREELIAAASLLRQQDGRRRSARQFIERLGLSDEAMRAIEGAFPRAMLMDETFQFSREEFVRHAPYRAVELDNGGLLIADDARFDEIFRSDAVAGDRVRYTTEGKVVDEGLRRRR